MSRSRRRGPAPVRRFNSDNAVLLRQIILTVLLLVSLVVLVATCAAEPDECGRETCSPWQTS